MLKSSPAVIPVFVQPNTAYFKYLLYAISHAMLKQQNYVKIADDKTGVNK